MVVEEELSCDAGAGAKKARTLFPHQNFVRSFLQPQNPYRGLLLYYGLGTGKTCASIGVADLYTQHNPPVSVLLPASLANNYKKEVIECAEIGLLERTWSLVELPGNKATARKVAKFLKVPEDWAASHPRFSWPAPPAFFAPLGDLVKVQERSGALKPDDPEIKETIDCILKHHYQFIHYNGLSKKLLSGLEPFTGKLVVIDEAHNFISQVVNGSVLAKKLYKMLMEAEGCKIICLTGTPLINKPYELVYLLNMLRGEIRTFETSLLKGSSDNLSEEAVWDIAERLQLRKYINDVELRVGDQKLWFSFVPRGYVSVGGGKLVANTEAWPEHLTDTQLAEQIHGALVREFGVSKVLKTHVSYALPYDQDEFLRLFLDSKENTVKNQLLLQHRIQGTVAYFKSTGEKLLPAVLSSEILKCPMSNHQFKIYQRVRDKERSMEKKKKGSEASGVYRAFSRMICNFAFPEKLKRPYPHDLRKEMDLAEDTGAGAPEGPVDMDLKRKQAQLLDGTMEKLVAGAPEFFGEDLVNYSPKFEALYNKLVESPGTALLYTQFRTMEGIGIFREVLKARGWQPVELQHVHGKWKFSEPLEAGKRRFIVFPEDRTKANILLDLFNSRWAQVPVELRDAVPESTNLRGEFAQLLMITQSGAEGLSLRNVRQVHILEPYWNQIRLDQVIGRAVRTCSHQELPATERNLRVYTYVATLTPAQLKDAFTIRRMDQSRTSDEHILEMAKAKDHLIQAFLDLLKTSSVDCRIHAAQNLPKEPCFAPPMNGIPSHRMFHPQGASVDIPDYMRERQEKRERVKGSDYEVVVRNGHKVVREVVSGKLFDYQAFKYARNLVALAESPRQST